MADTGLQHKRRIFLCFVFFFLFDTNKFVRFFANKKEDSSPKENLTDNTKYKSIDSFVGFISVEFCV